MTLDHIRQTLEFYADPDSYEPTPRRVRPVISDAGLRATITLGEIETLIAIEEEAT